MVSRSLIPRKAIVIGAGLGGLACAIRCRRMGLEVVVLERAPEFSNVSTDLLNVFLRSYRHQDKHLGAATYFWQVGTGVQIPPNSSRVLRRFGLLPKIEAKGTIIEGSVVRCYEDGRVLCTREQGGKTMRSYGAPWMYVLPLYCSESLPRPLRITLLHPLFALTSVHCQCNTPSRLPRDTR
jgi:salicylate hydroxylase